jgi:hypothetical protein
MEIMLWLGVFFVASARSLLLCHLRARSRCLFTFQFVEQNCNYFLIPRRREGDARRKEEKCLVSLIFYNLHNLRSRRRFSAEDEGNLHFPHLRNRNRREEKWKKSPLNAEMDFFGDFPLRKDGDFIKLIEEKRAEEGGGGV